MKREARMDHARQETEKIAEEIEVTAVQVRQAAETARRFVEDTFRDASGYDLSVEGMDARFRWMGGKSYECAPDEGKAGNGIVAALGAVPFDDEIKRELRLYEHMRPELKSHYKINPYLDEVLYVDKKSLCVGQTFRNFGGIFEPGVDIPRVCREGATYFDYYAYVDAEENPAREARWAPIPFIDLIGVYCTCIQAPVYKDKTDASMSGFVTCHYNVEVLNTRTVAESGNRLMIVSSESTLVGISPGASEITGLDVEKPDAWSSPMHMQAFVRETLNLEAGKPDDIAELARRLKREAEFEHALSGTTFTVVRKTVPELGFHVLALI
jgi:hypothetical protein